MDLSIAISSIHGLKDSEAAILRKGNFHTVADLVSTPIPDIVKRCRHSTMEVKRIVNMALDRVSLPKPCRLDESTTHDDIFTTGDDILDNMLGGGVRTGMVWDVVGESAAGKTQFALQLSLCVQLPEALGGLSGSACYLTTSSKLPTARLLQISQTNERLASECGLEHVHTLATPTVSVLQHVLTNVLPQFVQDQKSKAGGRSIKLLVIDALGELFHSSDKTTTSTLVQRSKDLAMISSILHDLAFSHRLTILVLNEVIDKFDRYDTQGTQDHPGLLYEKQSGLFNSAEFFGERKKEASLGLAWANQVNTRIILSRTGRRKYLSLGDISKRMRLTVGHDTSELSTTEDDRQPTLIRRLSVIFSNVCLPFSLDYIVTESGVTILSEKDSPPIPPRNDFLITRHQDHESSSTQTSRDSVGAAIPNHPVPTPSKANLASVQGPSGLLLPDGDEDDYLWSHTDSYEDLDWDALEQALSQAPTSSNIVSDSPS